VNFNSPIFLFIFLPALVIIHVIAKKELRNVILLLGSLLFLSYVGLQYLIFYLVLILVNWFLGLRIQKHIQQGAATIAGRWLTAGVSLNIGLLIILRLASQGADLLGNNLFVDGTITAFLQPVRNFGVPIGFSYIFFQCLSYLIDIYNEIGAAESNLVNFSLYITFFPKIMSGPITRYRAIASWINDREVSSAGMAAGMRRFIIGFAKKTLIADIIGRAIDPAFALDQANFPAWVAWFILIGYTVQLYYDFSGYTDMAIGLGKMFGFSLPENFNFPYLSTSLTDFWRRWHITLSGWFRDYLFLPLEFQRRRVKHFRTATNLLFVFLLIGLWHKITLTFAIWGVIHGVVMAFETTTPGKRWLKNSFAPFNHLYTLAVVMVSWIFFRSPDLMFALRFIKRLLGFGADISAIPFSITQPLPMVENSTWLALVLGIIFCFPAAALLKEKLLAVMEHSRVPAAPIRFAYDLFLLLLLVWSIASMTSLSARPVSIYAAF
jgi:alginate O-acetyltransferase complex protein AlgI